MVRFNKRTVASIALVVAPLLVLILQQSYGFIPIVSATDGAWVTVLCGVGISAGFALVSTSPRGAYRNFMLAIALILGVPLVISGVAAIGDVANSTNVTEGEGVLFTLNTIGSQVADWAVITQIITGLIPAAVIVVGVIMIYMGDGPDEYMTAVIETLLVVGVLVVSTLFFSWMGISLW